MSSLSDVLRVLRLRLGLSQDELAKAMGLKRSAIGNYERGIREPDLDTIEAFADFFNVSVADLIGRDEKDNSQAALQPKTKEWKMLSAGFDKMTLDEQKRVLAVVTAMYPDKFNEGNESNEP